MHTLYQHTSKLKAQWSDKVAAIDSLEHSLKQLQESHSEKEAALVMERDEALQRARSVLASFPGQWSGSEARSVLASFPGHVVCE